MYRIIVYDHMGYNNYLRNVKVYEKYNVKPKIARAYNNFNPGENKKHIIFARGVALGCLRSKKDKEKVANFTNKFKKKKIQHEPTDFDKFMDWISIFFMSYEEFEKRQKEAFNDVNKTCEDSGFSPVAVYGLPEVEYREFVLLNIDENDDPQEAKEKLDAYYEVIYYYNAPEIDGSYRPLSELEFNRARLEAIRYNAVLDGKKIDTKKEVTKNKEVEYENL